MDFHKMSCTKLRNFLESKKVKWLSEEMTLSDIIAIERRLATCSGDAYSKAKRVFQFLKHSIARRK